MWVVSNHMFGSGDFWNKSPSFYSGSFKISKNAVGQFIGLLNMWLLVLTLINNMLIKANDFKWKFK